MLLTDQSEVAAEGITSFHPLVLRKTQDRVVVSVAYTIAYASLKRSSICFMGLLLPAVWTFLHEVDQGSLHGVTLDFLDRDIISKNRPIFNVFCDVIEWKY